MRRGSSRSATPPQSSPLVRRDRSRATGLRSGYSGVAPCWRLGGQFQGVGETEPAHLSRRRLGEEEVAAFDRPLEDCPRMTLRGRPTSLRGRSGNRKVYGGARVQRLVNEQRRCASFIASVNP